MSVRTAAWNCLTAIRDSALNMNSSVSALYSQITEPRIWPPTRRKVSSFGTEAILYQPDVSSVFEFLRRGKRQKCNGTCGIELVFDETGFDP